MFVSRSGAEAFADARQKKRAVFCQHWNGFIQSRWVLSALILCSAVQGLFLIFSRSFLLTQAFAIGLLRQEYPFWCDLVIFALQLLLSAPGSLFCIGLWQVRAKTRWVNDETPDISDLQLLRKANLAVCTVTGLALALYPTVIITAGEYLKEDAVLRVFYLFLASTALLAVSVTLIRIVLRGAEENITCCWADTKFVLPLILVMLAVLLAVLIYAPLSDFFYICVALLALSFGYILTLYWLLLKKIAAEHSAIDDQVIASREDPNDPYNRY